MAGGKSIRLCQHSEREGKKDRKYKEIIKNKKGIGKFARSSGTSGWAKANAMRDLTHAQRRLCKAAAHASKFDKACLTDFLVMQIDPWQLLHAFYKHHGTPARKIRGKSSMLSEGIAKFALGGQQLAVELLQPLNKPVVVVPDGIKVRLPYSDHISSNSLAPTQSSLSTILRA